MAINKRKSLRPDTGNNEPGFSNVLNNTSLDNTPDTHKFTVEEVKRYMPKAFKGTVTQEIVDVLNTIDEDPVMATEMKERFISYSNILGSGRYKLSTYLSAIKYVSLKLINYSDIDAYKKTFPDRYNDYIARGKSPDFIAAIASTYNKGQLITDLMAQVQIPSWVLNQDKVQQAINTLADIAVHGKSERARVQAADSLLTHLQRPEEAVPALQMNMQVNVGSGLDNLRESLSELVVLQKQALNNGVSLSKVINAPVIRDVEPEEIEEDA